MRPYLCGIIHHLAPCVLAYSNPHDQTGCSYRHNSFAEPSAPRPVRHHCFLANDDDYFISVATACIQINALIFYASSRTVADVWVGFSFPFPTRMLHPDTLSLVCLHAAELVCSAQICFEKSDITNQTSRILFASFYTLKLLRQQKSVTNISDSLFS